MKFNNTFQKYIWSAILLCFFSRPVFAGVDILFETETKEISPAQGTSESPNAGQVRGVLHVVLGKDYLQVEENGLEYVYDFPGHKVYLKDSQSKKYETYSLYAYPGFRGAELENRLLVYDNFRSKGAAFYLTPVILEHFFSIKSNRQTGKITDSAGAQKTTFTAEGMTLMEVGQTGKPASKKDLGMFLKFLRYRVGGHPEILNKLVEKSFIPDWFDVYTYDAQSFKTRYKISSVKDLPETSYSLEGYTQGPVKFTGEMIEFAKASVKDVEKNAPQKMAEVEAAIKDFLDNKNYLEAALGCLEISLYNSRFDAPICKSNLKTLQDDGRVKTLLNNLNSSDRDKVEVSYQILKELESYTPRKAYVLWVFEANFLGRMGEAARAFDLYYGALKANPYLAGAYKDAGELFYSNYKMDMAWFCWDIGRKIYPEHSMLKEVDKFEEDIVKRYPEFF